MRSLIVIALFLMLSAVAAAETFVIRAPSETGAAEVTYTLVTQAREVPPSSPIEVASTLPPQSAPTPPTEIGLDSIAKLVTDAVATKNWALLACAGVLAAVYLVRRLGSAYWPWLSSDRGGVAVSFVVAVFFALASALQTGTPLSFSLVLGAILTAASASGLWTWGKKLAAKPALVKS